MAEIAQLYSIGIVGASSPEPKCSLTTAIKHQVHLYTTGSLSALAAGPEYNDTSISFSTVGDQALKRRVEVKIADGDVTGAVRVLCSDATLAPVNHETLRALQKKHLSAPPDLHMPPPPDSSTQCLQVSMDKVEQAIQSFNPGSAAGPDKLRPQYLIELCAKQTGEAVSWLLSALSSLANIMLAGRVPESIISILFGANLIALRKPDGGVLLLATPCVAW